jgi:hypothetical protein
MEIKTKSSVKSAVLIGMAAIGILAFAAGVISLGSGKDKVFQEKVPKNLDPRLILLEDSDGNWNPLTRVACGCDDCEGEIIRGVSSDSSASFEVKCSGSCGSNTCGTAEARAANGIRYTNAQKGCGSSGGLKRNLDGGNKLYCDCPQCEVLSAVTRGSTVVVEFNCNNDNSCSCKCDDALLPFDKRWQKWGKRFEPQN